MLVHIVMWKVLGPGEARRAEQMSEIAQLLKALPAQIPQVERLRVGTNVVKGPHAADIVLYAEFANLQALEAYQQHTAHLQAAAQVAALVCDRRVIDFLQSAG